MVATYRIGECTFGPRRRHREGCRSKTINSLVTGWRFGFVWGGTFGYSKPYFFTLWPFWAKMGPSTKKVEDFRPFLTNWDRTPPKSSPGALPGGVEKAYLFEVRKVGVAKVVEAPCDAQKFSRFRKGSFPKSTLWAQSRLERGLLRSWGRRMGTKRGHS